MTSADAIDRIIGEWALVHPGLDTTPMAVLGRAHRLSLAVAQRVEEHFGANGISRGDYDVLATLRRAGDPPRQTPGQLSTRLMLSSAGVTGRLNRLERHGLIRRLPASDDGRVVLVELTAEGRDLVDRLVYEDMARQMAWVEALSATERSTLERLTRKLLTAVEADQNRQPA